MIKMMVSIICAILQLVAGIGLFLIACSTLSSNLESVSGPSLRKLFYRASKSKMLGVGIGTVATAIIQSSGATAVMVIGFVNAGIMSLSQGATLIYGAAIGTTVTGQIVALGLSASNGISTTLIFASFTGIGAFIKSFAKSDNAKKIGGIVTGFGMLFVGLQTMSESMHQFATMGSVTNCLASFTNPVMLILAGIVITVIVQSSSVTTSVAITMLVAGLINLDQGIYLTLGSNIGTCSVALIAGFTSGCQAKRTALIQLLFKTAGVVLFVLINMVLTASSAFSFGKITQAVFPGSPQTQLAMFHTFFNVIIVALSLPFTDWFVLISKKIVKDDKPKDVLHLYYLDYNMMKTPSIAARQVKEEIMNMSKLALENFNLSIDMICNTDLSKIKDFEAREKEIDFLNSEIQKYVVELQKYKHSEYDRRYLAGTFRSVNDLERIGDYAENVTEYATLLYKTKQSFSQDAISEIRSVQKLVNDMSSLIFKAYYDKDFEAFKKADQIENMVDEQTDAMAEAHIQRLNQGLCTASAGAQYLSLSENMERIADHLMNIGKTIFTLGL